MTRAEKRALLALAIIAAGFFPPATLVTGKPEPFVLGLPLNFLWLAFMVLVTTTVLLLAYRHVSMQDGFPDEKAADDEAGGPQP